MPSLTGAHEFQVSTISGIKGGKLMCETRNELKLSRTTYQTTENTKPVKKSPPQQKVSSTQTNDKKDWTLIKGNKQPDQTSVPAVRGSTAGRGSGGRGATAGRGAGSTGRGRGRPRT